MEALRALQHTRPGAASLAPASLTTAAMLLPPGRGDRTAARWEAPARPCQALPPLHTRDTLQRENLPKNINIKYNSESSSNFDNRFNTQHH